MSKTAKTTDEILDSVIQGKENKGALATGGAPAVIGQPIYEGDLEYAKMAGAKDMGALLGQKINDKSDGAAIPLNFGSKAQCGHMPHDVRLRLFNLKKMVNNVELQAAIKYPHQHITADMMTETPAYKHFLKPALKAYNITDFSNWIPTVNTRFYFEEYELPFLLANAFDQMPMDSATVEVPGDTGHLEGVEETDSAVFTAQSTTQANYAVTARNNVVHTQITEDLLSDSSPAYIDKLRRDVVAGIVRAYERCIINGDITGSPRGASHQDSDTQALALNATFAKAFNGLRKKAFANDTALGAGTIVYDHSNDTASKGMFAKLMELMGKFSSEKDDLIFLVPSIVEHQVVTGAIPELFTAFAFGGLASNVTGQMPPIFGVRGMTSQFMREDLNASGVYDGSVTDRTAVILFKKSRFLNFVRQAIRVWAAPSLPSSDIMLMTAKMRHAWNGNNQSATEKSIVMAINVAKS
jgi:hypothetical protein